MEEPKKVYAAMNRVSAELAKAGIAKDSHNRQQGFDFRGIDAVHCTLGPILAREGLLIIPNVESRQMTEHVTAKGSPLYFVVVDVDYTFISVEDGSMMMGTHFIGEAMDTADKATNKAMSVAYKYMAIQTFCIPTRGQDDADYETHEPAAAPNQEPQYDDYPPAADPRNHELFDAASRLLVDKQQRLTKEQINWCTAQMAAGNPQSVIDQLKGM